MPYRKIIMKRSQFNEQFCRRTLVARESTGMTQPGMARELGLKEDTYSKYERRSPLPHYLIPSFCNITGHDPAFLFYGRIPSRAGPLGLVTDTSEAYTPDDDS